MPEGATAHHFRSPSGGAGRLRLAVVVVTGEGAQQRFWRAFKQLGDWYDDLPPY